MIATRSPSRTRVTPAPVATTSPANSCPRICGFCAPVKRVRLDRRHDRPGRYSCRSVPQIPHGATGRRPRPRRRGRLRNVLDPEVARGVEAEARASDLYGHDPLGPQAREEIEERGLGVADAVEPEPPAAPHVGERLDGAAEIGVRVPPRRERVDVQVAKPVRRTISGQISPRPPSAARAAPARRRTEPARRRAPRRAAATAAASGRRRR
jgi:hypothetical protein